MFRYPVRMGHNDRRWDPSEIRLVKDRAWARNNEFVVVRLSRRRGSGKGCVRCWLARFNGLVG